MLAVALLTTALSWGLVHLLFALEYAKLYYVDHRRRPGRDRRRAGSNSRAATCPNTPISSTSRSSSASPARPPMSTSRPGTMRRMALLHGLIAFLFNTVILAATINIAASLS